MTLYPVSVRGVFIHLLTSEQAGDDVREYEGDHEPAAARQQHEQRDRAELAAQRLQGGHARSRSVPLLGGTVSLQWRGTTLPPR